MANHASHAALPYPVKGARFTVAVPYLDADGDPTDPTTPDTEISKDGGSYADCAEEVTTISGSNGSGYITLSGAETDCSFAMMAAKVASGPKNTLLTLYPRVLPVLFSGTATAGAASSITLATDVPAIADLLIGAIVKTTGGTGGGGTGGANNQARVITDYSTGRVASVVPNWETNPSTDTTYEILLTEACAMRWANLVLMGGDAQSSTDLKDFADAGYDPATNKVQGVVLVDTLTTYTGNTPQTGDAYAIVNDGTFGNSAIKTAVDTIDTFVDTEVAAILAAVDTEIGAIITAVGNIGTAIGSPSDLGGGATIAANLVVIESHTDDIGTAGAGLSDIPWNADWVVEVENAVWDATLADHDDSGSTGEALGAAGSAGDPWTTALPGSYTSGQAGFILGTNLDATVSSRSTQTSVNTIDDLIDTEIGSIISTLATILGHVDTEVASIITTLGSAGAGLSAIPWNATWDAQVESEVDDALIAKGLDHLVFTSVAGADIADNSIIAQLTSRSATADWDTFDNEEHSLEAIAEDMVTGTGGSSGDVNVVAIDGDVNAAVNAKLFFTSGYGPLILRTVVVGVTNQTDLVPAAASAESNSYVGCVILIRRSGQPLDIIQGIVIESTDISIRFDVIGTAGFVIAEDDIIEILAPAFSDEDRDTLESIETGTGITDVNVVQISGSSTAADNLELMHTTGYGPLVLRTTVAGVTSQTNLVPTVASAENNSYVGCAVMIRRSGQPLDLIQGVVTESTDISIAFDVVGTAGFTIQTGDIIEILAPVFSEEDRDTLEDLDTGGGAEGGIGAGILLAKIGESSLTPENFLEIIQGEEKRITFIVESVGRFAQVEAEEIRVALLDPEGNQVTKADSDIERVCEELEVQIIRITLTPEETYELIEGLLTVEIAFDNQKVQLTHSLKIEEGILGT